MADEQQLAPEAQKILAARRDAIAELKSIDKQDRAITDHAVRRLATARLFAENVEMRIIAGEPVSSAEVRTANEMIEQARQPAVENVRIEIAFIERAAGPATAGGAEPVVASTLDEVRARSALRAEAERQRKRLAPIIEAKAMETAPAAEGAPPATLKAKAGPPAPPKPMTAAERNKQFHDGGFVRDLRATDGWMLNMGLMARRRNEGRTIIERLPNPNRAT